MAKRNKENEHLNNDNGQEVPYAKKKLALKVFYSFEEQAEYERQYSASLSSLDRMLQLRKMIDAAYRMHGFDPNNLPDKHTITIK
jgi:hypothetical protein